MHQAVKGRNETRFVFLASSIDPLFLFTLYSICPLTLVSIYDDCIHEHDIFYCIDTTFVFFYLQCLALPFRSRKEPLT